MNRNEIGGNGRLNDGAHDVAILKNHNIVRLPSFHLPETRTRELLSFNNDEAYFFARRSFYSILNL